MRKFALALLSLLPLAAAELRIRVSDETNRPIWARLEVRDAEGKTHQPAQAIRDATARNRPGGQPYYIGSFVIEREASLEVPPGRYTVIAEHGLEYERASKQIQVSGGAPAEVAFKLAPWVRMIKRGWYSGDMHIHRPPENAPSLALAEDLNVSIVFTMWNKRNLWDGKTLPDDPVVRVTPHHLVTVMNAEDERGGGAWMMHHLRKPLGNLAVDGRWFPAGIEFVKEARAQKPSGSLFPWFDCEKPFWWEVPVMMALATPDSFGVLHNHFNQYGIHDSEAWGKPRDQQRFPGPPGFVDSSLSLYYRYLNLGFRVPASAGSASGVLPNPVGYNRVYAQVSGPFSVEAWYRAIRNGDSFVTNGPMLFTRVSRDGSRARVSVEALSREPMDRLEIVANGSVIHSFPGLRGKKQFKGGFEFDAGPHTWVAARSFLPPGDTIRLAHSNPVPLGGAFDARADARYFIDWIDALIEESNKDPKRFAGPAERDQVLGLYRRARAFYEEKAR